MLSRSVRGDTTLITSVPVYGEVTDIFGFYVKGRKKLAPDLEIYARAGVAGGRAVADTSGLAAATTQSASMNSSFTGFSYGLGIKFAVAPNVSVVGDYLSIYRYDLLAIDAFSVGLAFDY